MIIQKTAKYMSTALLTSCSIACSQSGLGPPNMSETSRGVMTSTVNLWRYGTGSPPVTGDCATEPPINFPNGALVAEPAFVTSLGGPGLCAYRWESPAGDRPPSLDEISLHPMGATIDFEPAPLDLHIAGTVAREGTALFDAVTETHRARFLDQAGAWTSPNGVIGGQPVTVVVVDDGGWHRNTVVRIIEELACPNAGRNIENCPVTVHAVRAFNSSVHPNGGATDGYANGDAISLARALEETVLTYGSEPGPLVINLSLGIVRHLLSQFPRQVTVLRAAINFAACNGAILVAAAGNDLGFRTSQLFTAPADGFSLVTCEGPNPTQIPPILAATAGLKSNDLPLSLNRGLDPGLFTVAAAAERATPNFAAAGAPPLYRAQMTGSSAAAAVVSAAVAAALSVSNGFNRDDLRRMLNDAPTQVSLRWIGGDPETYAPIIRAIDAVRWACQNAHCSDLPAPYDHGLVEIDTAGAFYTYAPNIRSTSLPPLAGPVPSPFNPALSCVGGPCRTPPTPLDERMELVTHPNSEPICDDECELVNRPPSNQPTPQVLRPKTKGGARLFTNSQAVLLMTQNPPSEFIGGARTLELSDGITGILVPLSPTEAGSEEIDIQSALDAAGMPLSDVIHARIIYEDQRGVSRAEEITVD